MQIIRSIIFLVLVFSSVCIHASVYDDALESFKSRQFAEAVASWESGAQMGNAESQFQLGILFAAGLHAKKDLGRAIQYFQAATKASHREAAYALAAIYIEAEQRVSNEAMSLLLFSEQLGYKEAASALVLVRSGLQLPQHYIRLAPLIEKQEALLSPKFSESLDKSPAAVAKAIKTYNAVCQACHVSGAAGAPLLGRRSDWRERQDDVTTIAIKIIKGYKACPPRGGNFELGDDEVRDAVAYMLDRVRK